MPKVTLTEHVGSYTAISKKMPQGLQALKLLLSLYDLDIPDRAALEELLAPSFHETENGSDRTISRSEVIEAIVTIRDKYSKHQFDLKHAYCMEYTGSHHTVFFEAVRFLFLQGSTNWVKVPVSGKLDVKITQNRLMLKDAVVVITARTMTSDTSQVVARDLMQSPRSPTLTSDLPDLTANRSSVRLDTPSVPELPAAVAVPREEKPLPGLRTTGSSNTGVTRTPTVTSGSSAELDGSTKASWN
ncbi:hypothetical protein LTR84_011251 [Exophiala bonariae]|uniref:SnoaL-like domain-containing protein n=1 Tax=Exophiala bonariae TaxID=1690606 RepID=A0AAV9MSK4_9EURO|nr:hypothetical protein LTR84_011251 [Exophiala bonariae]